jgi:hypothetical protein
LKTKRKQLEVLGKEITAIKSFNDEDCISLTDIAKHKNPNETSLVISHWLSTRYTVEFLDTWKRLNNPAFNTTEFSSIRNESDSNGFVLSTKYWVEKISADVSQLVCLSNLENLNAHLIQENVPQSMRLEKLNKIAIQQIQLLINDTTVKKLEDKS